MTQKPSWGRNARVTTLAYASRLTQNQPWHMYVPIFILSGAESEVRDDCAAKHEMRMEMRCGACNTLLASDCACFPSVRPKTVVHSLPRSLGPCSYAVSEARLKTCPFRPCRCNTVLILYSGRTTARLSSTEGPSSSNQHNSSSFSCLRTKRHYGFIITQV